MVGVAGFEPATPSSRTRCATRLRYTPNLRPVGVADRVESVDPGRETGAHPWCGGFISPAIGLRNPVLERFFLPPVDDCRWPRITAAPRCPPARRCLRGAGALAIQSACDLGRSQAVRQRFLVPPCAGSNPAAPARSFPRQIFVASRSCCAMSAPSRRLMEPR